MKTHVVQMLWLGSATALAVATTGCRGPMLVSRPMTAEQAIWCKVIKRSYPAWQPPYYSPVQNTPPGGQPAALVTPPPPPRRPAGTGNRDNSTPEVRENPVFVPAD